MTSLNLFLKFIVADFPFFGESQLCAESKQRRRSAPNLPIFPSYLIFLASLAQRAGGVLDVLELLLSTFE